MVRIFRIYLSAIFILASVHINAQNQEENNNEVQDDLVDEFANDTIVSFGDEVKYYLRNRGRLALDASDQFETAWERGDYDQNQQTQIKSIFENLKNKSVDRYRAVPYFFLALANSDDSNLLGRNGLNNFLNTTEKALDEFDAEQIENYFEVVTNVLARGKIYRSNYNNIYMTEGQINFEYIEPEVEAYEEEIVEEEITEEEISEDDGWFSDWDTEEESTESEDDWGGGWSSGWDDESEEDLSDTEPAVELVDFEGLKKELQIREEFYGPVMTIENTDLSVVTTYDSIIIAETGGKLAFNTNVFYGDAGKVNWKTFGISEDSVFAKLEFYQIPINRAEISSPKAFLTYDGRLEVPIEGVYEFKSQKRDSTEKPTYPRFRSYVNDAKYSDLRDKKLSMVGGFALKGDEHNSSSLFEEYSIMEASSEGKRLFKARGKKFIFGDSTILSERASLVIYDKRDSIYHPGLIFDYDTDSSVLVAVKDHSDLKYAPFVSTSFKVEIQAEEVQWDLDEDSLNLSRLNAQNQVPVTVESIEFYDSERFVDLTGIYPFNPLLLAIGFSHEVRSLEFYLIDLATARKQNPNTVRAAMVDLSQRGYIDFDRNTDLIKIKKKGLHFYLSHRKRKDYDNFSIVSLSPTQPNTTVRLDSQHMKIRGIEQFVLSDPLNVFIEPKDNEIILFPNRDFEFDGKMTAGSFEYVGQRFRFDYDSFLVAMPQVDSLKFKVDSEFIDEEGKKENEQVSNQLVETGGTLYINDPNNKSALKSFPQYPIYDGSLGATVYFNSPDILDGVYDRELSFSIPPFSVDSVSSDDASVIGFTGTFASGGIFPPFEQKLQIMPDRSLGFTHKTPPDGFTFFDGRAMSFGDIRIDTKGLQLNGTVEFQSSTLKSDDFVIYQDSVIAMGSEVNVDPGMFAGASFPDAQVIDYRMKWLPKQDSMYIFNNSDPINLYQETATLDGNMILSSMGMFGDGKLLTRGSETESGEFNFKENSIKANHSNFKIQSDNPEKPALNGEDVQVAFDLDGGMANISPEIAGIAAIDFPYAQYKTSISNAEWDLNAATITMTKEPNVDISNSYFYTTREDMDSLVFNATGAIYDINNLTLNVSGVPYIVVADAKIAPENNELFIRENSEIDEFYDASLEIDTVDGFHNLIHGQIKIISRNKFEGDATYRYVNAVQDTFNIKMGSFILDSTETDRNTYQRYTVSSGKVEEYENVIVSPGMIFKGGMTMYAKKPALELDGYVKLDLKNVPGYDTWIAYESDGEIKEVVIPFNESVTEQGEPLTAGLLYENTTNSLYSTFVTDPRTIDDEVFFTPSGFLTYNAVDKQFIIEEFDKKNGDSYVGNTFIYNETTSDITFEGDLTFLNSTTSGVELTASGSGQGNLDRSEFDVNALLSFGMDLPSSAIETMGLDFLAAVEVLNPSGASQDKTALLYKIASIIGDRITKDYEERSFEEYIPLNTLSNKLVNDVVITDVDLSWSETYLSWYNTSKIGLSHMQRIDINAEMDGFIEFRKDFEGDVLNLFLQITPDTWYYFNFEGNSLLTFSSNPAYNDIISSKSNSAKAKLGEFVFAPGSLEETESFVNRYRSLYYGIEDIIYLEMRAGDNIEAFAEPEPSNEQSDLGLPSTKKKKKKDKKAKPGFDPFGNPAEEEEEEDDDKEGF